MAGSITKQAATVSRVATSTAAVLLLAAGAARGMTLITNEAAAILYVKFGPGASATDYTVAVPANGYYEMPVPAYGGQLTAVLASGTGNAQVTSY